MSEKKRPTALGELNSMFNKIKHQEDTNKVATLINVNLLEPNKGNTRSLGISADDLKRWLKLGTSESLVKVEEGVLICPESLLDVPDAPKPGNDRLFRKKEANFQKLVYMAKSIHQTGRDSIPPIDVLQDPNDERHFVILRGHRRQLSHIIAGESEIYAFIRNESFNSDNKFKLYQQIYAENKHHEKLTLDEELASLNNTIRLFKEVRPELEDNSYKLKTAVREYLSMSNSELTMLWALRNAPMDLMTAIQLHIVKSLRKAYDLSKVSDPDLRLKKLIVLEGGEMLVEALNLDIDVEATRKAMGAAPDKSYAVAENLPPPSPAPIQEPIELDGGTVVDASDIFSDDRMNEQRYIAGADTPTNRNVSLGAISDQELKKIVSTLLEIEELKPFKAQILRSINLNSTQDLSKAWGRLLKRIASL